jgi:hypothetical protein
MGEALKVLAMIPLEGLVREQRRRTHVYPSLLAEIFDLEIISYLIF